MSAVPIHSQTFTIKSSLLVLTRGPLYYRIVERNHSIESTWWGGYLRHNELYQQTIDVDGRILKEHRIVENDAIMMYSPLIKGEDGNAI